MWLRMENRFPAPRPSLRTFPLSSTWAHTQQPVWIVLPSVFLFKWSSPHPWRASMYGAEKGHTGYTPDQAIFLAWIRKSLFFLASCSYLSHPYARVGSHPSLESWYGASKLGERLRCSTGVMTHRFSFFRAPIIDILKTTPFHIAYVRCRIPRLLQQLGFTEKTYDTK
ncbi:hypothetical protein BJV82DRAFT_381054 [Fennellomyces sp. T-0311]|nr:hypothetical protein BJV82DRAFT_381054 [Fennellomyces sp. T-0311]